LRLIERGNRFQTLVFGDRELPDYIRVGKFMSKVRIEVMQELPVSWQSAGTHQCNTYLNAADIPAELELITFDLISIPPVSLFKNLHFHGPAWQVGDFIVPANLNFCGGTHHAQSEN
jgi:CRISPR-associated protein Csc1